MQTLIDFTIEVPMIYFIPMFVCTMALIIEKFDL